MNKIKESIIIIIPYIVEKLATQIIVKIKIKKLDKIVSAVTKDTDVVLVFPDVLKSIKIPIPKNKANIDDAIVPIIQFPAVLILALVLKLVLDLKFSKVTILNITNINANIITAIIRYVSNIFFIINFIL